TPWMARNHKAVDICAAPFFQAGPCKQGGDPGVDGSPSRRPVYDGGPCRVIPSRRPLAKARKATGEEMAPAPEPRLFGRTPVPAPLPGGDTRIPGPRIAPRGAHVVPAALLPGAAHQRPETTFRHLEKEKHEAVSPPLPPATASEVTGPGIAKA